MSGGGLPADRTVASDVAPKAVGGGAGAGAGARSSGTDEADVLLHGSGLAEQLAHDPEGIVALIDAGTADSAAGASAVRGSAAPWTQPC